MKWSPVELASAYEVRCGDTWDSAEILIQNFSGTSFVHYQYEAGTYYYHIRSVSATGDLSPNVTTYKLELKAPATPEDVTAVVAQGRIDFVWKSNKEDDLSHYEMREGQNWDSGVKVAESKVSQMSIPSGSKQTRMFWLKAIALPKIYSDKAAWIEIGVQADDTRNIVVTHNARTMQWPSNLVNMEVAQDDVMMESGYSRSEYIHKMELADKITAQNSFYTSISTVVQDSADTVTWENFTYPWSSKAAMRSWRLGGDAETIGYENQIARQTGLIHEIDGFSLEEKLESEKGIVPSLTSNISYDWGRYTKGLKITDLTRLEYKGKILDSSYNGLYKFSFWLKMSKPDSAVEYQFMKFGNKKNALNIMYNTENKTFKLVAESGEGLEIQIPIEKEEYIFFAVSQSETQRVFGVGVLGGEVKIKTGFYKPIGDINYMNVGQ